MSQELAMDALDFIRDFQNRLTARVAVTTNNLWARTNTAGRRPVANADFGVWLADAMFKATAFYRDGFMRGDEVALPSRSGFATFPGGTALKGSQAGSGRPWQAPSLLDYLA